MPNDGIAVVDRRMMLAMTASAVTGTISACAQHSNKDHSNVAANARRRFENKVVLITGATSGRLLRSLGATAGTLTPFQIALRLPDQLWLRAGLRFCSQRLRWSLTSFMKWWSKLS
jgi:hypothetical protein